MKVVHTLLVILVTAIVAVKASPSSLHSGAPSSRHDQLARIVHSKRSTTRRCPKRSSTVNQKVAVAAVPKPAVHKAQTPPKPASSPKPPPPQVPPKVSSGLINVTSPKCGPNGATEQVTHTTGPNGKIDWLNCGINDAAGWSPPFVKVSDIKTKQLSAAVAKPGSPFKACEAFVSLFEQHAGEHGFPAILLASFAMQESSCNPNTVGGNGEQGLMQLTKDKCGDAPGGNCKDPNFNIKVGAAYFVSLLDSNGGDLLLSIGQYNGWFPHMTYSDATAAGNGPFCTQQNNLDYIFQLLNGWCQNINAYDTALGKYFNLNKCHA